VTLLVEQPSPQPSAQNPSNQPDKRKTAQSSYPSQSKQHKQRVGLLLTHSNSTIFIIHCDKYKTKANSKKL
jgi:hypothetical protein